MPDRDKIRGEQCWRKRTGLEKKLIYGSSILGAIVLLFLLINLFRKSCDVTEECNTKNCVKAAAELLEFIDLKVDPCQSFYRYACGSYLKNAVKKDFPSPWTSTRTLFKNEIKGFVVDQIGKNDSAGHIALKQFYHECMNTTKIDLDANRTFMKVIDELGGWPLINESNWKAEKFNWADWYIKAKQLGLPVIGFFDFKKKDVEDDDTVILEVTGPHMDLTYLYGTEPFSRLMRTISKAFGGPDDKKEFEAINKITKFLIHYSDEVDLDDVDINEYSDEDDGEDENDEDDDEDEGEEVLRVQNLTMSCPKVPWLKILNGISGNSSQFDNSSIVTFQSNGLKSYCKAIDKLLNNTKPQAIANFFIWSIIHHAHKYMGRDIRRIYQDVDGESDERFTECYDLADQRFKYVKETAYIRRKSNAKVRADLFEMIEIMKELFIEHLKVCSWMDETTRKLAVEKANKITSIVGSLDELYDYENFDKYLGVDGFKFTTNNIFKMLQEKLIREDHHLFETLYQPIPEDWTTFFEKAVEVNAFFLPGANLMVIPAPILTSVFYNRKFPAFMNYGPMGSTVGHELMHGFSKNSRTYALENDTEIDWWTDVTEKAYDKAVQCVIDEYESIPFRYRLNGSRTLEENLADYVGADIGYEGYQRYVKKHGKELKLAGLPLTPEQIYWVQTATNFCFRKLDDNDVDFEEADDHGIPAFRVEAPAKNSIYFAEAFNCPIGSRMNPKPKCRIL